jgi:ELWxxDGT repeat protein
VGLGGAFYLTSVGGRLFFREYKATQGVELWSSDGTAAGTKLVKDINPGSANSTPLWLTNVAGKLFFEADDGTHGRELWKAVP